MTMTEEALKAMPTDELKAFVAAGQAELDAREKRRREETIAKIRALAETIDVPVSVGGTRGRPLRKRRSARPGKADAAR